MFDKVFYDACANRAYYAALQAAIAALADKGIKRDKIDHKQIQADFSENLIKKRKVYPSKLKSYLMDIQGVRNQADYSYENVSRQEVSHQMRKAEEMITLIEKELKK